MALEAFATPEQMEARTQGAIPATRPFLEEDLKAATQRIRNHCGWHIAESVTEHVVLNGQSGRELFLPTTHLTSLDGATIDGRVIDLVLHPIQWSESGVLWRDHWAWGYRSIDVQITHGFAEVPADIVSLTLQMTARALSSPLGAVREQTLTSSVTWSQPGFNVAGGMTLLDNEIDALAEYRVGYTP